jgi:hypothetical protein
MAMVRKRARAARAMATAKKRAMARKNGSCDGGRRQLRRQATAGEGRCCNGDCDGGRQQLRRWATAGKGSFEDGRWHIPRRRATATSTAGDGRFDGKGTNIEPTRNGRRRTRRPRAQLTRERCKR